jgi:uncharacterized protein (TIRG00374 family)
LALSHDSPGIGCSRCLQAEGVHLISVSTDRPRLRFRRLAKSFLAAVFTSAALWLSFRRIDARALAEGLRSLRWGWIVAALANILLGVYILGLRWRILLRPRAEVPPGALFRLNVLSQFVNIVMPARLGEVARLFLAARERSIPASFVLGTIGAEKVLDVLVFAGLWMAVPASLAFGRPSPSFPAAAAAFVVSAALFAVLARRPEPSIRIAGSAIGLIFPSRRPRAEGWLRNALQAIEPLRKPSVLAPLFFWTAALIINQALSNFLVFRAFDLSLPTQAALFVLLAVQAGTVPPSLPGKIGVFEYAVVLALGAYAVPQSAALTYAVVLHLVAYLPKIILGAVFMTTTRWNRPVIKSGDGHG